jgi:capsular polysaccharide biosynthesis protein
MDLRGYFQLLLRRWPVLLVTMVVGVSIAYVTTDRSPHYEASSTLLVSPDRYNVQSSGANISFDGISVIDRLLVTYSRMIKSATVANGAADLLNNDLSAASISAATRAEILPQTQLLRVVSNASDPTVARDLSNAVAQSFVNAVNTPPTAKDTASIPGGVPVTVFERASLPGAPLGNRLVSNLVLGAIFGLLVAAGACIAADAFDVTVRSVRDAERPLGSPELRTIPPLRQAHEQRTRPSQPEAPSGDEEPWPAPAVAADDETLVGGPARG